MKHTFKVKKSDYNFSLHTREFDDETGKAITSHPTVEFEVMDGVNYVDAEDFFGVFDEVTALAENYDLIAQAVNYAEHHTSDDITEYDPDLIDLIDTAIDMINGWMEVEVADNTMINLGEISKRLHDLE